jgi:hypothetical protein
MNSISDAEVQSSLGVMDVGVATTVPKPKRVARSRELAMLLENIDNLAPPSADPCDRDSKDDSGSCNPSIGSTSMCRPVKSYDIANGSKPTAAEDNVEFHTAIDAAASRNSSAYHDSSALLRVVDGAGCDAPNPSDCALQQQCINPLHNISSYRSKVGDSVVLIVTGAPGLVYGDIVYADDSSVAAAAVHAGLLALGETKSVCVYILGPYKGFVASIRNSIKSYSYPKWPGSFSFAPDALQQAAAAAAERKRLLLERRAAAKAAKSARDPNSSESSQASSSSDSEPVAAHWDTPVVPEHLQALAQIGANVCL